jgi:GTP-binding protein HflX
LEFFESYSGGKQSLLVSIRFIDYPSLNADIEELQGLVRAAYLDPQLVITGSRRLPDPKYFVGEGKLKELQNLLEAYDMHTVIFNHKLTPSQERNIEAFLKCRIIDRHRLILEIFHLRAYSHEGKLQVKLARLNYMLTRLIRGWTHLERQRGGIGMRSGPGEKQIELDRRMINERIKKVESRLAKVKQKRDLSRASRQYAYKPTIALIGYTNTGKSSLFNLLSHSDVYVGDKLFATVDPTLRKGYVPALGEVILSDTVGFIKNLPYDLIEAFHATLKEAIEADLLLHVIDYSSYDYQNEIQQVNQVLQKIGADQIPVLNVYNKIDKLDKTQQTTSADKIKTENAVYISVKEKINIEQLYQRIPYYFHRNWLKGILKLPPAYARVRAQLYDLGVVQFESFSQEGEFLLHIHMAQSDFIHLSKDNGLDLFNCFSAQ